jgi:hypothetical protein
MFEADNSRKCMHNILDCISEYEEVKTCGGSIGIFKLICKRCKEIVYTETNHNITNISAKM